MYRLLYNLNKNTKIKVRTPVGDSEWAEIGPALGQGGIESAVISSVSLDNGFKDYFPERENNEDRQTPESENDLVKEKVDEIKYGNVVMNPLLWQDDILAASKTPKDAQINHNKIERLITDKQLEINLKKTVVMVAGAKKARVKMHNELEENPLTLCKTVLKEVPSVK